MPSQTFHDPRSSTPRLERGVHVDDKNDPNFVLAAVVTACGHEVELAKVDRTWWTMREVAGTSIETELRVSLAKRCTPWSGDGRCAHCPFPPDLQVIRCQPGGG